MDSNGICCNSCTTFNMTSKVTASSRLLIPHQLHIKFNFIFKSYYLSIFDSTSQNRLSSNVDGTYGCSVVVENPSSLLEDMVEAINDEIGDRLDEEDLMELVDMAWKEVTRRFPSIETLPLPPKNSTILCLGFEIRTEHMHVYYNIPQEINLDKYEVNSSNKGEEGPCSICLEELDGVVGDGGGALKTPCSHVFHGGCIKKWLRTSRSCPFCRSQI